MIRNAAPCLQRFGQNAAKSMSKRGFVQEAKNAKEVPQAEAKGKFASQAPTKPSEWKGTQRGHLVLGVSGVLCAGILYSWVKSQNADKPVLADTNHKGENKGTPAASY